MKRNRPSVPLPQWNSTCTPTHVQSALQPAAQRAQPPLPSALSCTLTTPPTTASTATTIKCSSTTAVAPYSALKSPESLARIIDNAISLSPINTPHSSTAAPTPLCYYPLPPPPPPPPAHHFQHVDPPCQLPSQTYHHAYHPHHQPQAQPLQQQQAHNTRVASTVETSACSTRSADASTDASYFEKAKAEIDLLLSPTTCSPPLSHPFLSLPNISTSAAGTAAAAATTAVDAGTAGRRCERVVAAQPQLSRMLRGAVSKANYSRRQWSSSPRQCHLCGKTYTESSNLAKHIKTVHFKLRPFKCTQCSSSFAEKNKLGKHIQSVHERARPYKCELCDATFSQASDRKRHRLVLHEGFRPYVCEHCGRAFGRRSSLAQHCQRVHKVVPSSGDGAAAAARAVGGANAAPPLGSAAGTPVTVADLQRIGPTMMYHNSAMGVASGSVAPH